MSRDQVEHEPGRTGVIAKKRKEKKRSEKPSWEAVHFCDWKLSTASSMHASKYIRPLRVGIVAHHPGDSIAQIGLSRGV